MVLLWHFFLEIPGKYKLVSIKLLGRALLVVLQEYVLIEAFAPCRPGRNVKALALSCSCPQTALLTPF